MEFKRKFIRFEEGIFSPDSINLDAFRGNEEFRLIVSVVGVQSVGKSSLLNGLIDSGSDEFLVLSDEAEALSATTKGIDISERGDIIYLDVEGCYNNEEGKSAEYELKLFTLTVFISDCIILLVRDNDHTTRGGFFTDFLNMVLFNSIGCKKRKKNLVVVVRDKKNSENVKEKIVKAVRMEWDSAVKKWELLNSQESMEESKFGGLDFDSYFTVEVFFVLFDYETDKYREEYLHPVRHYLESIENKTLLSSLYRGVKLVLKDINNPDGDGLYASSLDLDRMMESGKTFQEQLYAQFDHLVNHDDNINAIFSHDEIFSNALNEFKNAMTRSGVLKVVQAKLIADAILIKEENRFECIKILLMYYRLDIYVYRIKIELANLKSTFFEKFAFQSRIKKLNTQFVRNIEILSPDRRVSARILRKKDVLLEIAKKNFLKDVIISGSVNSALLIVGVVSGGLLGAGLRMVALGVRAGTMIGTSIAGALTFISGNIINLAIQLSTDQIERIGVLKAKFETLEGELEILTFEMLELIKDFQNCKRPKWILEIDNLIIQQMGSELNEHDLENQIKEFLHTRS